MMICAAILIGVVAAMVLEKQINVPMQTSAIIGGLLCVLTGCLTEKQAYQGVDWTTIFLFAGMLPPWNDRSLSPLATFVFCSLTSMKQLLRYPEGLFRGMLPAQQSSEDPPEEICKTPLK